LGILFFKLREKPDEPSAAAVLGAAPIRFHTSDMSGIKILSPR
jgi:hypothetical protein